MTSNYLSIDIGGTYLKYAYFNESGSMIKKNKMETPMNLKNFKWTIHELVSTFPKLIKGVAISCPGKVNSKTGTVYFGGSLPFLDNVSMKAYIEKEYQISCSVINDGKAAALSELWLGNLKGIENGVAIVLGTGVGGGIVLNNILLEGSHYQAGELSFMLNNTSKKEYESLAGLSASAVAFVQRAAKVIGLEDKNDGQGVFFQIEMGNKDIIELFRLFCYEIAHIIVNVQAVFDMERVVIGGGISEQEILIEEIQKQYHHIRQQYPIMKTTLMSVEIVASKFKNDSNLIGALYHLFLQMNKESLS